MSIRKRDPGFTFAPFKPFPPDKPFPPGKPFPKGPAPAQERQKFTEAQRREFEATKAKREAARKAADARRKAARVKKDAARRAARLRKDAAELAFSGPIAGTEWVGGLNDRLGTCMATAVANSLLAVTGIRVADEDVLDLHERAGGTDDGSVAGNVLHELCAAGIGGIRPAGVQAGAHLYPGAVCSAGPHAVAVTPDGIATWGGVILPPDGWEPDRAWEIRW